MFRRLLLLVFLVFGLALSVSAQQPVTITGTAAQPAAPFDVQVMPSGALEITGTWTGTIQIKYSNDGVAWYSLNVINQADGSRSSATAANGVFLFPNTGYRRVGVYASAWASGTATVTLTPGFGGVANQIFAGSVSASLSNTAATPLFVQQTDGATAQTLGTADLDSGAGTQTRAVVGIAVPASGGFAVVPGDATNGLKVQCASGCSGGTTDVDDATIAVGQTTGLQLGLTQVFDGAAWKRFTVGVAGTPSTQVVSVQGIASGTVLPVSLPTAQNTSLSNVESYTSRLLSAATPIAPATATATTGLLIGGQYNSAPPTFTNGQQGAFQMTAAGALIVSTSLAGNVTVVQPTGTSLHAVLDTTSTTAVTQATASNLKVEPAGNVASGATDSGNPVKVGGIYNSSPITLTTGQRGDAQLDANGYVKVNVAAGSAANAAASATGSAVPASAGYTGINVGGTLRGATALAVGAQFAQTIAIVDASGNQITAFGGSGGTSISDEGVFTIGTTSITPVGGTYKSTRDSLADNAAGIVALNIKRGQFVTPEDSSGNEIVASYLATHGTVLPTITTVTGGIQMGRASAAVPSNVSADNDAVAAWFLLSGAQAVQPTYAGVLATTGNGVAGTGVPRVAIASDNTAFSVNATLSAETTKVIGTINLAAAQTLATVTTVGAVTAITNALPTGANVIGHVIADTGSTTAVTQATAANLKAQVAQVAAIATTVTLQNAVVANGNGTLLSVDGMSAAGLTVNCAACSGGTLVNFEGTEDGVNFSALQAVQLGTNTIASTTTTAGVTVWDLPVAGLVSIRARVSAYSAGTVTITGHSVPVTYSPKITNANATLSAETTKVIGTARLLGNTGAIVDAAPRAAAPANGLYNLYMAVNAEQAAATNGQTQAPVTDLVGKTITLPYANPENFVSGVITTAMTATTSTSLIASPGGALRNYITSCTASNAHATVGTDIYLQDGSGGTTLWVLPAAAVYGGAAVTFPTPLRQPTTATALYAANVTTGASTKIACAGYKGL